MNKLLSLLVLTVLCGSSAFSQTSRTWTGSTSTAWGTASNWSPSGVPATIDHVAIPNTTNKPKLSANVTIANFSITGGELDLDGDTLTINGTLSMTGGTVKDGLVKKTSTSTITITGVTVECELDISGHTIGINTSRFKEPVKLTKTGGTLSTCGGNVWEAHTHITVHAGLRMGFSGSDTILADLQLTRTAGSLSFGNTSTSAAAVFSGSSDQMLLISGTTISFNKLTINKPSGDLNVSSSTVIASGLNLTKGIMKMAAGSTLTIQSGTTVSGTSHLSYVEGAVLYGSGGTFTFPIGRNGRYRPLTISSSSGKVAFKAEYFRANSHWTHSHTNKQAPIEDISRKEYWVLERPEGSINPTVTIGWDTVTSCPFDTLANLMVTTWGGSEWKDLGNGGTTGNALMGTITTNSTSSYFGLYTIATKDTMYCKNDLMLCGPHHPVADTIEVSEPLSPTVADRYGNKYPIDKVSLDTVPGPSGTPKNFHLCTAGYFALYFEVGSGMENTSNAVHNARRDAICAVFTDLSDFIASPLTTSGAKVNVWIRSLGNVISEPTQTSGVLGAASAYHVLPPANTGISGIKDNQVWITINSGADAYTNVVSPLFASGGVPGPNGNFFHCYMAYNFDNAAFNWNAATAAGSTSQYDLYTIGLHEAIHALGFASLIDGDGSSKFGAGFPYYARYDMFLQTQAPQPLITSQDPCSLYGFGFNGSTSVLAPNTGDCVTDATTCGSALEYESLSVQQLVYTPNCFEPPSTLSHFEDQCQVPGGFSPSPPASNNLYFVMSNANGMGTAFIKRYPTPEERLVLCDLGYAVDDSYGGSGHTATPLAYDGDPCPGLQVAGINDGITTGGAYEYIDDVGVLIEDIAPLTNDYNADEFGCLEVIFGAGTISNDNGTTFDYTPTSAGIHLLRYIPLNTSSGNEGNITYIIAYGRDVNCEPSSCDLVSNGDFELATSCGPFSSTDVGLDCWTALSGTPDILTRGCTANGTGFNVGTSTFNSSPPSDSYNGTPNDRFCGYWATRSIGSAGSVEASLTLLSSPLIPDTDYILSFVGKVNNNYQGPASNIPAPVYFGSVPDLIAGGSIMGAFPTSFNQLVPSSLTTIPNDNQWHPISVPFTFTSTEPHDYLIVSYDLFSISNTGGFYFFIDDISIQPASSAVTFSPPATVCSGLTLQDLDAYVLPPGGTFVGPGVSCSMGVCSFNSSTAGLGQHILIYSYTDINDCEHDVPTEITVLDCACPPTPSTNSGSWPKHGESDDKTRAHSILSDAQGNVYVTGFMYGLTGFDLTDFATIAPETAIDMFVARYSHDGNSDWVRQFGNDVSSFTTDNVGFDLAIDGDCNLIVTGKYDNSIDLDNITLNGSALQGFIMKLDALDGSVLAAENLTVGLSFHAVAVSAVTGSIYTMSKELDSYPDHTVVVSKFDSDLDLLETASFGTVNPDDIFGITGEITRGISVDGDDNVYVTVNLTSPYVDFANTTTLSGASIAKFDSDLDEDAGIVLTTAGFSYVLDIVTAANGLSYATGMSTHLIVAELPASLASVTDDWLFEQYFVGTAIDIDDTHLYYAGVGSSTDIVAGKAARSNGAPVFSSIYTSDVSVCNSISADSDGNAYIAGAFTDEMIFDNGTLTASNSTHFDTYAARLDASDGESFKLDGGEDGPSADLPRAQYPFMAEVYPNPTDGLLHVRVLGLEDGQRAVAELFDMRGALLHRQVFAVHGGNEQGIGLQHLPPASYLLKLSAHGHRSFHRVTLVR